MKIATNVLLIALISVTMLINADVGCEDNSYHLTQKPDYKTYHKVSCNCPCYRYKQYLDRGKCEKCLHYRDPQMFVVMRSAQITATMPTIKLDRPAKIKIRNN